MAAPEGEPKVLESLLLSVAHHWSLRETGDRQVELLERHFRQDEMISAQKELAVLLGKPEKSVPRRNPGTGKATKAQALDVVETLRQLSDKANTPRFLVQSDDLPRIAPLLGELSVGDERGVAARLEALERSHRQGLEKMERMIASVKKGATMSAISPQVIVTSPTPSSFAAAAAVGGGMAGVQDVTRERQPGQGRAGKGQGQAVQRRAPGTPLSFFSRGRQEGGLQAGQGSQPRQDRSSSAGKRQRTDEEGGWQEQRPYRSAGRQQRGARPKAQVVKGSSTEFAELAGPVTWWVGKCRPEVTEGKVKEVLTKLAEKCGVTDFTVESVHGLTKDTNPWSRSFKVCVPARLEEQMRNPQMYPASWESRAFTQWPTRQQKGPRLQETPRVEESSQLQEASRAEGLQLQEDTPTGNRQVGEGETMQVVDAADEAAAGEPPKM
jgi:hypothetical protein